ncbi:urea carboxylase-associated family protein [Fulvivirgaceae bacterium BMA10]|uniref:Urea carboxylase-associated family protein n=1 Tax=Splendidivirga corallicola TaxID=3051826 RepID=A0ABT8KZ54_9BACT|nr:urea carboxylase-associated family protein [Fulvivirgaceae bacterium BMA10]
MEIIKPQTGRILNIAKGQLLKIIDLEGKQVADFWAFDSDNHSEFLSAGVTIDCNNKLLISTGDILYSNLYRPLFEITEDTTGLHDLIHPCCRKEMFEHFYSSGNHPSCLDNLNQELTAIGKSIETEINPFNIFMNTRILKNGKVTVEKPVTKPGDYIVLKPLIEHITVLIAACSVDSGNCNGGHCSSIGFEIM